jgi:hypothetical protein
LAAGEQLVDAGGLDEVADLDGEVGGDARRCSVSSSSPRGCRRAGAGDLDGDLGAGVGEEHDVGAILSARSMRPTTPASAMTAMPGRT